MVDQIASGKAASAYLNTAKIAAPGTGGQEEEKLSFGSLIKGALEQVMSTQKASEKVSAQAVIGKADLTQVVQAVTEAETTLQTVVAVRDRLIAAYQDIMRMPI